MLLGFNLLLWTTHVTDEHFPLFAELKRAGSPRWGAALASAPPSGSTRGRRRSAPTNWNAR